jgi:hypothetical protein
MANRNQNMTTLFHLAISHRWLKKHPEMDVTGQVLAVFESFFVVKEIQNFPMLFESHYNIIMNKTPSEVRHVIEQLYSLARSNNGKKISFFVILPNSSAQKDRNYRKVVFCTFF